MVSSLINQARITNPQGLRVSSLSHSHDLGSLAGASSIRIEYAANQVPSFSTLGPGDVITISLSGVARQVKVMSRVDECGGGWGSVLTCVDGFANVAHQAPWPKSLRYVSLSSDELKQWREKEDFPESRQDTQLRYTPIVKESMSFGVGGHSSNRIMNDLARRAGFAGLFTNLLSFDVRQIAVEGSFLDAILSLAAPFSPLVWSESGVLYILDGLGLRNQGWRGSARIVSAQRVRREASYLPKPDLVRVVGGEGAFNPLRYPGPLSRDAKGNPILEEQRHGLQFGFVPTALFGEKQYRRSLREDSWQPTNLTFLSYGAPVTTMFRTRANLGLFSSLYGKTSAAETPMLSEALIAGDRELVLDPNMDKWKAEIFSAVMSGTPGGKNLLLSIATPGSFVEADPSASEKAEDTAAKDGEEIPARQVSVDYQVYGRTVTDERGPLVYSLKVMLSRDKARMPCFESCIEELNLWQDTSYRYKNPRLASIVRFDESKQHIAMYPCQIRIEWGWATVPKYNPAEARLSFITKKTSSFAPQAFGASREWIPLKIVLNYKLYADYPEYPYTEEELSRHIADLRGAGAFSSEKAYMAQLQSIFADLKRQEPVPSEAERLHDVLTRIRTDAESYFDATLFNSNAREVVHPKAVPRTLDERLSLNMPSWPFRAFNFNAEKMQPGDLIYEEEQTFSPVFYDVVNNQISPLSELKEEGDASIPGVFLPISWSSFEESDVQRGWDEVFDYEACLVGVRRVFVDRVLASPVKTRRIELTTVRRAASAENPLTRIDTSWNVSFDDGEPPRSPREERSMEILVEEHKTAFDAALARFKKSSDNSPLTISIPSICSWMDAEDILRRVKWNLPDHSYRWEYLFPLPLFFDVGWQIRVENVQVNGQTIIFKENSNTLGTVSSVNTDYSAESGGFTAITVDS